MKFQEAQRVLDLLTATASPKEKLRILSSYKDDELMHEIFYLALNPFMRYKMTELPQRNVNGLGASTGAFNFLRQLAAQSGASNADAQTLADTCTDPYKYDIINCIIKKDMRCGVGKTIARKIWPDIPRHEVMLCGRASQIIIKGKNEKRDIDDLKRFLAEAKGKKIACDIKLNGVRVWAVVDKDYSVKYLSRNGIEYPNFSVFDNILVRNARVFAKAANWPIIFDAEITSSDKNLQTQMSEVRRLTDADPSIFRMQIFDCPNFAERDLTIRHHHLMQNFKGNDVVWIHPMNLWEPNLEQIILHLKAVTAKGEEGLVLKHADSPYDFKRSTHWIKLKMFYEADVKCVGYELGKGKYAAVVGKLKCVFTNGKPFKVGSGLSDPQRKLFLKDTPKMVEIKYKELTNDGVPSFPVFVQERGDK